MVVPEYMVVPCTQQRIQGAAVVHDVRPSLG